MDEDDDVCSADLEAEAELEAEYTPRSLYPEQYRLPPSVVHANQEAYYAFGFTQGANEADGAGPASSEEENTGPTGAGFAVTETRAEIPGVGTAVLYMPN